jgi:ubiquinone/menaquinone biosynthesis C-methylase UbiE
VSLGRIKAEQRAMYEAGEYRALSETLRPAARDLVLAAGVAPGQRVLDVGSGDGSVAIDALANGASVVGCDLSLIQMTRAQQRDARALWLAADAEQLPFADESFDVVLSSFGAVFAPDPLRATAELFRVVKPGGVVALTSWADGGFMAEMTAAVRSAAAAPDRFPDQDLGWGSTTTARARFSAYSSSVEVARRTLLIDPAVRGAAGAQDCAARYLAQQKLSGDLEKLRTEISTRHLQHAGLIRSEYLMIIGRVNR